MLWLIISVPIAIGLWELFSRNKSTTINTPTTTNRNRLNNDHGFSATLKHSRSGKINTISSLKDINPSKLRLMIETIDCFGYRVFPWDPINNREGEEIKGSYWTDDKGVETVGEKCVTVAFSPNGENCVVASADNKVSYWKFYHHDLDPTYQGAWRTTVAAGNLLWLSLNSVAMAPKGNPTVYISDRETRTFKCRLNSKDQIEDKNATTKMNLLPNGDIITSATDKNIRLWCPTSGLEKSIFPTEDTVTSLIAVDNDTVLYGMNNGTLALLNLRSKVSETLLEDEFKIPVSGVSVLTNGLVIKGNANGNVITWDPLTRKVIHNFKAHESNILSLVALPDNKLLTSDRSTVSVWE